MRTIRIWDKRTNEFATLEYLKDNGFLHHVCSVDFSDDIYGAPVRVAINTMYPYVFGDDTDNLRGYIGAIWSALEDTFEFRSIYTKTNRSMGDAFMGGAYDVSLRAVAITSYRAGHYSYTHQIATNTYSLFTLSEGARVSAWWYAKIFRPALWAMTFVSLLVIALLLFIMYRLKKALCTNYIECNNELSAPSFIFLCVVGGITGQGMQKIPSSWSLRCLIITSLLTGVLTSCGFSSTLTSHLAIKSSTVPISNLKDIVRERTHSLCFRKKSAPYSLFSTKNIADSPLAPEWEDIVNTPNCPNMENSDEVLNKLCEPKLVYLETPVSLLRVYQQVNHLCEIVKAPEPTLQVKIGFSMATSWPYRKLINKYLMRLRAGGILKYFEKKWIPQEFPDGTEHKLIFQPVEQGHMRLIFIGLCIMFVISAIICILENIWFRFQRSSEITRRKKKLQAHVQKRFKQWNSTTQLTQSLWI
ncbi:glutamate receptor ionotropic, delta-1-like [Chelonus insularis]|uniref:glutamate receptor ionotropic, delta-1-like n=1 Tax=Chelonus insularis TaxID=460826 RepID=UPI00158D018F|nr:glutamate receptor ionotropic, delta-1-like [Chelonus insularis]